ncbi:MAG: hypothetical protein [Apis rhabdovirus 4]|uniref:Glycoprotein n=1 Tax=Apis rhabdovirus 4 TaxID=2873558 RepID=A0A8K1J909_9RHAB|nr:MAG: hypothetical protein [Apis rhabdovirus 4]
MVPNLIALLVVGSLFSFENVCGGHNAPLLRGHYLQVFNITHDIPIPPEPVCEIRESESENQTGHGVISIWSYESNPQDDHYDFLISKYEVTTSCTVYFFGAEERSIISTIKRFILDSDLTQEPLLELLKELKSEISPRSGINPTFDCSWTGTREVTSSIYQVQRIKVKFSPDSTIVYPFYKKWTGQRSLLQNGELLVLGQYTKFDICDLKLHGLYPGIISKGGKGLTVSIPSRKEFFYVFPNSSAICHNITVFLTSGGYLISILDNTSRVDHHYLDSLHHDIMKRSPREISEAPPRSQLIGNHEKLLDEHSPPASIGFGDLWDDYHHFNSSLYHVPISITALSDDLKSSRSKRSLSSSNKVLSNYQLTFSRAELQWGLNHLADLTKNKLLRHHLDLCLLKQAQWRIALSIVDTDPSVLASLITQVEVPEAAIHGNLISINKTVVLDNIVIDDPLVCVGRYCKLSHPSGYWLEGSTGVLVSNHQDTGHTLSFVAEVSERRYIDLISNTLIHSMTAFHPLVWGDKWDYSFNSSLLDKKKFLYVNHTGIVESGSHPIIRKEVNLGNIASAVTKWAGTLGAWFWDMIIYIISIVIILYIGKLLVNGLFMHRHYHNPPSHSSWFDKSHNSA